MVEDLPTNMMEPMGNTLKVTTFVLSNYARNIAAQCSHTGIQIFVKTHLGWKYQMLPHFRICDTITNMGHVKTCQKSTKCAKL